MASPGDSNRRIPLVHHAPPLVPPRAAVDDASQQQLQQLRPVGILPSAPFIVTFAVAAIFAWKTLFPLLAGLSHGKDAHSLPAARSGRQQYPVLLLRRWTRAVASRIPAITFSVTIALSAVLAELIFCEISDVLDPAARSAALQVTITVLLASLVIVTPALEIHSITSAASWKSSGLSKGAVVFVWALDLLGLLAWLVAFWWIGRAVIGTHVDGEHGSYTGSFHGHGLSEGSLERIGIIGISLMASLAGFAAVSSLWQTFGVRVRRITDTDVARKQAGLDATTDMIASKESRLRALELKVADGPTAQQQSWMTRLVGSVRGSADSNEIALLRLEIAGLKTMQFSLSNAHQLIKSRREAQRSASTPLGRVFIAASYAFSLYCLYRIAATSVATLRRWWHPTATFATTDPINNVLALVAKHWDPSLDRAAWSRQISFLLSGLMLLASFNAVLQTVLLFSRFTPANVWRSAQQNLALLVSQITATYVVSSALLLRSNLPAEMGSVIEGALGAPLDTGFVERWFEGWFLGACGLTAAGIFVGRKVVGTGELWDELDELGGDEADAELGKLS